MKKKIKLEKSGVQRWWINKTDWKVDIFLLDVEWAVCRYGFVIIINI